MVRALGYARASLDERYHTGAGVAAQRSAVEAACRERGWELVEMIEDVGFSGRDLKRPGLQHAIEMLDSGGADCLVAGKLDRLSRSLADFATLSAHARRKQWGLLALDVAVDTTTPAGEAMANILATFAQFERRMISQRTKEAHAELRAQSRVYGTVPYGFHRDGKLLIRDPAEQRVVRRVRGLYVGGLSHSEIAAVLNTEGVRGRRGGRWSRLSVKNMLQADELVGKPIGLARVGLSSAAIYPVPYGYRPRAGVLVEDEREQAQIRRMRAMYRSGMSLTAIANRLTADGVPTQRGGMWRFQTVANIVRGEGAIRARGRAAHPDTIDRPLAARTVRPPVHPTPYGWTARRSRLVSNRREQVAIAVMRSMRNGGATLRQIATALDDQGIGTRKGGPWLASTVHSILGNKGVIRQRQLGLDWGPSPFTGLVGEPFRQLLVDAIAAQTDTVGARNALGEVSNRAMALVGLLRLWAAASDRAAGAFTPKAIAVGLGSTSAACRVALKSLHADGLVAATRNGRRYQLTIAGFGEATSIIDVTTVLASTYPP